MANESMQYAKLGKTDIEVSKNLYWGNEFWTTRDDA